mmetsp:Transcript_3615/g.6712  ORF Transcript_3615/g.6712 Transcript_3615/m.6712 type:complete len:102 (-) Transcript_3615:41-346(-)
MLGLHESASKLAASGVDGAGFLHLSDELLHRKLGIENTSERLVLMSSVAYLRSPSVTWNTKMLAPALENVNWLIKEHLKGNQKSNRNNGSDRLHINGVDEA